MKIRNGFVSNSSSASFIVRWEIDDERSAELTDDEAIFNLAFCYVFGIYYKDDDSKYTPKLDIWGDYKDAYEKLKASTLIDSKHGYSKRLTTSFWTLMYNGVADFGKAALLLNMALDVNGGGSIKLIDRRIDEDY